MYFTVFLKKHWTVALNALRKESDLLLPSNKDFQAGCHVVCVQSVGVCVCGF